MANIPIPAMAETLERERGPAVLDAASVLVRNRIARRYRYMRLDMAADLPRAVPVFAQCDIENVLNRVFCRAYPFQLPLS